MTAVNPLPDGPLIAFYGDDFTGSSAAMEVLAFAGLDTILFLAPPTPQRLAQFSNYRGIGIAGVARAKDPQWMDENLPPLYELLAQIQAPIVHYKLCSTFDSAPHIGNVGRAAEIGKRKFKNRWIPMVVSDPGMGRFQAFGNLFAHANGIGYRLDRHPTMSKHPITPMSEADLGRHLKQQTSLDVGLIDFVSMKRGRATELLAKEIQAGSDIVSIDVLDSETLQIAGRLIWEGGDAHQFVMGSQGIEQALVAYWRSQGWITTAVNVAPPKSVERVAVVSGSVSPITASQIEHAKENGFELIPIDVSKAIDVDRFASEIEQVIKTALSVIQSGRDPLVFSAAGPEDPRVNEFRKAVSQSGQPIAVINDRIGTALGDILNALIRSTGLRRVVISGGDTSSHAAQRLGIDALTAIAPMAPGAPLCRAHSTDAVIDGLEIVLKGGQTGGPNFFTAVRGSHDQSTH